MPSSVTVEIETEHPANLPVRRVTEFPTRRAVLMFLELFAAVQASLRAKVASLQEDNWMFEGEEEL